MRNISYLLTLFLFFFLLNHSAKAQNSTSSDMKHDTTHITFNESDITWMDAPPVLPKGAKMAVLQGDPSKEGEFTVRLTMPANYKISPHWHPTAENVTVVKGDFYLGTGDKFDENSAKLLNPGGFASIPATHHHFAFSKGECIVQVHGMGPFQITYINPADDPSKQAKQ
jgi:quercetin dioxygenase-like cupin family protein